MSELRGRPVHSQKLTSTPYLSVIQIVLTQSESDIYFQHSVHLMESVDEQHTVSSVLFDHAAAGVR